MVLFIVVISPNVGRRAYADRATQFPKPKPGPNRDPVRIIELGPTKNEAETTANNSSRRMNHKEVLAVELTIVPYSHSCRVATISKCLRPTVL